MTSRDRGRWSDRLQRLQQRSLVMQSLRYSLGAQGFLEIETPILVPRTTSDWHLDSFEVSGGNQFWGYLTTSTEYQIKRLMVGGFQKLFTLTKNFRVGDRGNWHSQEFTMLEWAEVGASLAQIEQYACEAVLACFQTLFPGQQTLVYQGNFVDLRKPWDSMSVQEAFEFYLGFKNLRCFSLEDLQEACRCACWEVPEVLFQDQSLLISFLLDQVQPFLGRKKPLFLTHWPLWMTASAGSQKNDGSFADRSELYIAGIELSDGFSFLTDPVIQEIAFQKAMDYRKALGRPGVALDYRYLEALKEGLPEGAGMALGVDRLVMLLTDATHISEVQAFDWDEL